MIDTFTIFSKGGLILYHYDQRHQLKRQNGTAPDVSATRASSSYVVEIINSFISTTLLDHNRLSKARSANNRAIVQPPTSSASIATPSRTDFDGGAVVAEWEESVGDNKDWIAVAIYPRVLLRHGDSSTNWIRHLLKSALAEFSLFYNAVMSKKRVEGDGDEKWKTMTTPLPPDSTPFDATFKALLRRSQTVGRREIGGSTAKEGKDDGEEVDSSDNNTDDDDMNPAENERSGDSEDENEEPIDVQEGIARLKARQMRSRQRKQGTAAADTGDNKSKQKKKKGKEMTVWHDGKGKVTKAALAQLDRSKDQSAGMDSIEAAVAEDSRALAEARAAYLPSADEIPSWEEEERLQLDDNSEVSGDGTRTSGWGSSLKGLFDQMSGNKVLTSEDLDAPLSDMQRMLTSKNVANEIATEICDGVRAKLVGKKMQSFQRVKTAVRLALESAIERILRPSPERDVDLLRAIVTKRERGRGLFGSMRSSGQQTSPYVIVMVGINGVGKSTSLAKIAYYLKTNGCNPLIAACDTFRSGAVEQLNVHAKCLDVPLYHKGYAKDPSAVAKAAIDHAAGENNDVVLVDTAGRMQNNVPLMKALSKLVVENQPDLVLFVCEALVGNDGMDQLFMFDKALRSGGHTRQIDGIVLTKFDTVSDKVGAALTMTHITGAPVVFVGTGQKYNHLKKLSVQSVIKSLFA